MPARCDKRALPAGVVAAIELRSPPYPSQCVRDAGRSLRRIEAAAPVVFEKSAFEIGAEPDRCGRPPWRSRPHAFDVRTKETRALSRRCRPACALAQLLEARATPSDIVKPAITRTSQRDLPAVLTRAKPSVRAAGPEAGGIDPRPAWFRPGRELEKPAFCVASGKARNVAHPQNHGLGFAYSNPHAASRARLGFNRCGVPLVLSTAAFAARVLHRRAGASPLIPLVAFRCLSSWDVVLKPPGVVVVDLPPHVVLFSSLL